MVAGGAGEEEVAGVLPGLRDGDGGVWLAAVNGPGSVGLSGEAAAGGAAAGVLAGLGHKVTSLGVAHAFHSGLMDPVLAGFAEVAGAVAYHRHGVTMAC